MGSADMVEDMKNLRSAATSGNWPEVLKIFKERRELRTAKIMVTGDTVLHMAVSDWKEDVVESMVDLVCGKSLNEEDETSALLSPLTADENGDDQKLVLGAVDEHGNTPLHLAALIGSVQMCKKIGGSYPSLIAARNTVGETPLFLAALYGMKEAFLWLHYLYMASLGVSSSDIAHCLKRDNDDTILHCAIAEGHFGVAIEIVYIYKDHMKEMMGRNKEGLSPLHLLAAKRSDFKSVSRVNKKNLATTLEELKKQNYLVKSIMFSRLLLLFVVGRPILNRFKMMEAHAWRLQIMNELLQHASNEDMSQIISRTASEHLSISLETQDKDKVLESGTITIETPLMIAAKNGVVEMVEKILELFPSRIKDVNAEGKNILLLAVEYRQTEVYTFLCKKKWLLSESLFRQVDQEGNNALHLAARLVGRNWINAGEINWFDFVKDYAPRGLSGRYNKKMETPEDIFKENCDELIKGEVERTAKTSEACSVVSTLVASVAFATRNSVPGGYDEQGYAILRNDPRFDYFVTFETLALFFSLISTICFLSIFASPSKSVPSLRSVSFKLYLGMGFMFSNILLLWGSFCAGQFFTLSDFKQKLHSALPNYIFMSLLIMLFVIPQLPALFTPIISTITPVPGPRREATPPIQYRRTNDKENIPVLSRQN